LKDGRTFQSQPPSGARVGYYSLWGIPTENQIGSRNADDYAAGQFVPWDSPKKTTDQTPHSVLLADTIEKGTDNFGSLNDVTVVPHSSSGLRTSDSGPPPEPEALGSEGGNVGLLDGSVSWRKQAKMRWRYVFWDATGNGTSVPTGYW